MKNVAISIIAMLLVVFAGLPASATTEQHDEFAELAQSAASTAAAKTSILRDATKRAEIDRILAAAYRVGKEAGKGIFIMAKPGLGHATLTEPLLYHVDEWSRDGKPFLALHRCGSGMRYVRDPALILGGKVVLEYGTNGFGEYEKFLGRMKTQCKLILEKPNLAPTTADVAEDMLRFASRAKSTAALVWHDKDVRKGVGIAATAAVSLLVLYVTGIPIF